MKTLIRLVLLASASSLGAQITPPADEPPIEIHRAAGPITIDGDLSDPGWQGATKVETFWETRPGDNVPAKLRTVGYLTYDDKALYAAFECDDPDPKHSRPVPRPRRVSSDTDYAGIILDTRHDRRTALEFSRTPAASSTTRRRTTPPATRTRRSTSSGTRRGSQRPRLDARDPHSALQPPVRLEVADRLGDPALSEPEPRYPLPVLLQPPAAGSNCFICHERDLVGLEGLPGGGHITAAPYVTATEQGRRTDGNDLNSRWTNRPDARHRRARREMDRRTQRRGGCDDQSGLRASRVRRRSDLHEPAVRVLLSRRNGRSSWKASTSSRRRSRPSIRGRSRLRAGESATPARSPRRITPSSCRGSRRRIVIVPGPQSSTLVDQDFSSFAGIGRVGRTSAGRM